MFVNEMCAVLVVKPAQKTPESNTGALLECKALQNNNKPGTVTFNDHTRPRHNLNKLTQLEINTF